MYFQIDNTPERVKKARKKDKVKQEVVQEECPRLTLAPFSKPPQVVFENVIIGTTCEKKLEVLNPCKDAQQITLGKSLPPGLVIHLPGECVEVEPETCYCVTLAWSPTQPTTMRETIRFTNNNRGRFDVIVVLKTVVPAKGKSGQPKFKTSPGKMKMKNGKQSPVAIYKKKMEAVRSADTFNISKSIVQTPQNKILNHADKENQPNYINPIDDTTYQKSPFVSRVDLQSNVMDHKENNYLHNVSSIDNNIYSKICPFDSPNTIDFNDSEVFSDMLRLKKGVHHDTYNKSSTPKYEDKTEYTPTNVLKPSNKQNCEISASDVFDNLTFTPLKSIPSKNDKLDKGPKIIVSVNSDSEFDDTENIKASIKEDETHSIICVTSIAHPTKWLISDNAQCSETPILNKKVPNTSSPKDLSPNFSINTDFSRISESSFFPQRFSTERKMLPRTNNETHDIIDDSNMLVKLSSDTYTKESPNTPLDYRMRNLPAYGKEAHPKICRQSLFREQQLYREPYERNYVTSEHYPWHNDKRADVVSPSRSLTPPLQSIPEESVQFSDSQDLEKDKKTATFTIDQTFERPSDLPAIPSRRQSTWSKRDVRAEPALWKIPAPITKKLAKSKTNSKNNKSLNKSNLTLENNNSVNQSTCHNYVENVYSQSLTVDPFLSSTYYYDEKAVEKIQKEFKRWLNYILTPPAELDSNVEQTIDVGKAWIENHNKEVPLAPTKEQVCSSYHNNHRLESLRRAARALLCSPEIHDVLVKLQAQIEKKLIAIRKDKNLHLDIGLQKIIMEILLSYNPLWLRIGLEAIYGQVLPLKSNNDIEGLTTFIIQRMFKNPNLKNKHSKTSKPNMLLPAYMEAIKKITLKKFFTLVFFLDQAKQKKLIPHDPCLFRRNAPFKESKEILINFTKELIAGIGDITRHLRPLGYVVSHKQSYLDEYIYAVHNIAADIRDGIRLTKVMEIILMRKGLLHQLRTPAISRLQKIHNVQVALNALKEANFVIVGDISAADIADGHREKTLSLLWQLIHVFRAPLFEKAATVIQTWWKKKYEVILKKRQEEERWLTRQNKAASIIQHWWQRVQYNRLVEQQMQKITRATIVLQKYWRMWLCRTRFRKLKSSAVKISEFYRTIKLKRQAIEKLQTLRSEREKLRHKSATLIQAHIRRWLCVRRYRNMKRKVTLVQSCIRRFIALKRYNTLKKTVLFVQRKFRGKLLMRKEMQNLVIKINSVILIQSCYRMSKQRKYYLALKKSVITVEKYYIALILMRKDREVYLKFKWATLKVQASFRRNIVREDYLRKRYIIIKLQRKVRANQAMKKARKNHLKMRDAAIAIQRYWRAYRAVKDARAKYITQRNSAILIQRYYRAYLQKKIQRSNYLLLRKCVIQVQLRYRSLLMMRQQRSAYLELKNSVLLVQRCYKAKILMREALNKYQELKKAAIVLQRRYRALLKMREEKLRYTKIKNFCIIIQNAYRAHLMGKQQRNIYLQQKQAAIQIQRWYRSIKKTQEVQKQYRNTKKACTTIQKIYRAFVAGQKQRQEFIRLRNATVCIQRHYRNYLLTKVIRKEFLETKKSTVVIQQFYRSWIEKRKQRQTYLRLRQATVTIQVYYRQYRVAKLTRQDFCQLKSVTIGIQQRFRSVLAMRKDRKRYITLKKCAINVQRRFRALLDMRKQREVYFRQRSAIITLQQRFKALRLMKEERSRYVRLLQACNTIKTHYIAYRKGTEQRNKFLQIKDATVKIQQRFRAVTAMRKERASYVQTLSATVILQRRFRARQMMLQERAKFTKIVKSCITIQRLYRARRIGMKQREAYLKMKSAAIAIQIRWREFKTMKTERNYYVRLRTVTIAIQRLLRARNEARAIARKMAASKIQDWYISIKQRNQCRSNFIDIRRKVVILQKTWRAYICRKRYLAARGATITLQRHYRNYKLMKYEREAHIRVRICIIKVQALVRRFIQRKRYLRLRAAVISIQAQFRFKKQKALKQKRRHDAAICIQKNVRRYLAQSRYRTFRENIVLVQTLWRTKLITRLIRCVFLQKKRLITKLQAAIRGHLARKQFQSRKENMLKLREEQRQNWAASKIQALFRGHMTRVATGTGRRAATLRQRWRNGALHSSGLTMKERNKDALEVLATFPHIESLIRAFKSLEILTLVMPMTYDSNASMLVGKVTAYMSSMNRSISSVEVLKSGAAIIVNLTRYRVTGPSIYTRERISEVLKFMWRFCHTESQLFCMLSTHIWLFSKYDAVKKDLTEFLRTAENHKMLLAIKGNVTRLKRMEQNTRKAFNTPQTHKFMSRCSNASKLNQSLLTNSANVSVLSSCSDSSHGSNSADLPATEPDYGIARVDRPWYFADPLQAVNALFQTYDL